MNTKTSAPSLKSFEAKWNYWPSTPVQTSPLCRWPLKSAAIWKGDFITEFNPIEYLKTTHWAA